MNNSVGMTQTIDSREVSKLLEKPHNDLMKAIRKYVDYLAQGNLSHCDFYIESEYIDDNGRNRPNYQITKKGCEFIAHKMTGQKGTIFTAKYINLFHEMESQLMNPVPIVEQDNAKTSLSSVNTAAKLIMKTMDENEFSSADKLAVLKGLYKQAGIAIPEKVVEAEKPALSAPKRAVIVCDSLKPMYEDMKSIYGDLSGGAIEEDIRWVLEQPVNDKVKRKMVQMLEAVRYEQ